LKRLSSTQEDLLSKVPHSQLNPQRSSLKVRKSLALLGLALSVGTTGALISQQSSKELKATPVAQSPKTLVNVLAQNSELKYELARAAIASGSWDQSQHGVLTHEVSEDETLWQLTQVYQVDAAAIAVSNGISAATELQPGTKLIIPPTNGIIHKVKPGDTLEAIANFYKVSEGDIVKFTSLDSPEFLSVDQPLVIPGNVSTLLSIREEDAKQRLIAKRQQLQKRLQDLEGNAVLVSDTVEPIKKLPKYTVYRVKDGDTIEMIARRYGISQEAILELNKLESAHWLELDQELKIPAGKPLPQMQTVASTEESGKLLPIAPAIVSDAETEKVASTSNQPINQTGKQVEQPGEIGVKVAAATPLAPPTSRNQIDPWGSLMQLAGPDLAKDLPTGSTQEELLALSQPLTSTTASNLPVAAEPVNSPELATAVKPAEQVAIAVFPFLQNLQDQGSLSLLEQTATGLGIKPNLPNGSVLPAPEPNLEVAAATITVAPANPARAIEQGLEIGGQPIDSQAQPAAEPNVKVSKVAVAPAVPNVSANAIEQNITTAKAPTTVNQPAAEPAVKLPQIIAAATISPAPATAAIEQNIAVTDQLNAPQALPANEPAVQVAAASSIPSAVTNPIADALEQSIKESTPTEVALLPDSEARMTSTEVKRLEVEVKTLEEQVQKAEIEAEARKQEAIKIAAAGLVPSNGSESKYDPNREAIAEIGNSGLPPELPQLMASAYLPDVNDYGLSSGYIWPADGVLTSGFGWRWGRMHAGIDIAAPTGTPIWAAASGVVEYAGWNSGGYGNLVEIRHADGTITRYAHMSAIYVQEGQSVSQTQVIGAIGSTGFSTGPHLHFEVRPGGGGAVNPIAYLTGR
jgi:murein DD-endopeptidase MepM/ murein hydrolase activator NlpD